jgi:uncharacterized protein (TIGR03435 family)
MALVIGAATVMGRLDRPVLDRTGLTGNFDFFVEWAPESNGAPPADADSQADPVGQT